MKSDNGYIIFGGRCYYAMGGGYDLLGIKQSFIDAAALCRKVIGKKTSSKHDGVFDCNSEIEWAHVMSVANGEIIYEEGEGPYGSGYGPVAKIEGIDGKEGKP